MTPAGSKIHTNSRDVIILHLVVLRENETRGGWKEECDKLQGGSEAPNRCGGRTGRRFLLEGEIY